MQPGPMLRPKQSSPAFAGTANKMAEPSVIAKAVIEADRVRVFNITDLLCCCDTTPGVGSETPRPDLGSDLQRQARQAHHSHSSPCAHRPASRPSLSMPRENVLARRMA